VQRDGRGNGAGTASSVTVIVANNLGHDRELTDKHLSKEWPTQKSVSWPSQLVCGFRPRRQSAAETQLRSLALPAPVEPVRRRPFTGVSEAERNLSASWGRRHYGMVTINEAWSSTCVSPESRQVRREPRNLFRCFQGPSVNDLYLQTRQMRRRPSSGLVDLLVGLWLCAFDNCSRVVGPEVGCDASPAPRRPPVM
jgi:hypothetical protein